MVRKGFLVGLLGGALWLAVMAGYDLHAYRPFTHTPKMMATLLLGTARADALHIGFPFLLGVVESFCIFVFLGVIFAFLSSLLPMEVSVVLGFIFGGAVAYFLFLGFFNALPLGAIGELDRVGLVVANLGVGVTFGLRMHK